MPPVIIAAVAYIAGAITVYQLAFVAIAYAYGQYQASRARRNAKEAYNASLKDRLVTTVTADGFRSRCYGRVRNVDGVLFKATRGSKSEFYTLVIALAGHECDEIETVYFNDVAVSLNADGYVETAPYSKDGAVSSVHDVLLDANGRAAYTPVSAVIGGSVSVFAAGARNIYNVPVPFVIGTGGYVDINGGPSMAGKTVKVTIQTGTISSKARVRKFLGQPGQDLSGILSSLFPGLIVAGAHRFEGICCLLVDLEFDPDVFPSGVPQITAVVRGAKVLDPRTGVTAWTENPALIARDWALYAQGGGATTDDLVEPSFVAAANACDVTHDFHSVDGAGNAATITRPLYTCGIVCRTEANPSDTLSAICESMAGKWAWTGGQLRVKAGAYSAPVATLTESWCSGMGDIEIVSNVPRTSLVNTYTATIADAAKAYVPVQAPRLAPAAYVDADGGELPQDITLEGVTDSDHALHVLGVMLRDQRQGLTGSIPCNLRAYPVEVFDTLAVDLPRFGFSGKTVEVLGWQFSQKGGVVLAWKETAASIFDPDATFEREDAEPNTQLPDPFNVPELTLNAPQSGTAQLLLQADGTIVSRVLVSWPAVQDEAVRAGGSIDVRYGLAGTDPELWQTVTVPGADAQAYLENVQDGAYYIITVRARNKLVAGKWCVQTAHLVLGKQALPAAVQGLSATVVPGALKITRTPSSEADYHHTLYRYGASWAAGTAIPGQADRSGITWGWPTPGTYTIWAVDVDTTGHEGAPVSFGPVTVTAAALAPTNSALSIKLNVNDFDGTVNYSEAYIHGRDSSGAAIDAPGSILVNGVSTAVPNGQLNTNFGPAAGYIVWDSAGATFPALGSLFRHYVLARRYQGQWQYDDNNLTTWTPFTPTPTMYIIGTLETGAVDAGNPGSPPGIVAASIWASASTLNALEAGADAAFAAATAAQGTADGAAINANSALSTLATMRNDGYLDASEKPAVIKEWQAIDDERSGIYARGTTYGLTTLRDVYWSAYLALSAYLSSLSPGWNDTSTDTPITPATDQAVWAAYYSARQALLNAISDETAKRAQWSGISSRPSDDELLNSYIASGANMCPNSDFGAGTTNWQISSNPFSGQWAVNGLTDPSVWCLNGGQGEGTVVIWQPNATTSGYFEIVSERIPVAVGDRYAISAYIGAHRCRCEVFAWVLDAAGSIIANIGAGVATGANNAGASGGTSLSGYQRVYVVGDIPAGAATIQVAIRKWSTNSGEADSWLFACRVMAEKVAASATTPGPWSPTGAGQWTQVRISAAQADAADAIAAAADAQATADGKVTTFVQTSAPTAEGVGDLWIDSDDANKLYRWSGSAWVAIRDTGIGQALTDASNAQATADGKIVSFYQASPPTAGAVGDLWTDTDDGNKLYRWSGSAWVSVRDAGIAQALSDAAAAQSTADNKIELFYQPSAPAGQDGDLWFDTDDGNKQYVKVSGTWTLAADVRIGNALTAAAGAQATADGRVSTFFASSAPTANAVGDLWFNTTDGRVKRWNGSSWATQSVIGAGDVGTDNLANNAATDWVVLTASSVAVTGLTGSPIGTLDDVHSYTYLAPASGLVTLTADHKVTCTSSNGGIASSYIWGGRTRFLVGTQRGELSDYGQYVDDTAPNTHYLSVIRSTQFAVTAGVSYTIKYQAQQAVFDQSTTFSGTLRIEGLWK